MVENDNQKEEEQMPEPDVPGKASEAKSEPATRTETAAQNQRVQTRLSERVAKNWQALLTVMFSLIAVGFSIGSCVISNRANQLSQRAIDTAIDQFFQENKPYIILKPIKYSKLQSYYKYTALPERNAVGTQWQFQIKNIGKAAAKDLAVFNDLKLNEPSMEKSLSIPDKITLGPGEGYVLTIASETGFNNKESYNKFLHKLSSEEGPEVTIRMGVTYLSEINSQQSFSSAIVTKITKKRAQVIKVEYEVE